MFVLLVAAFVVGLFLLRRMMRPNVPTVPTVRAYHNPDRAQFQRLPGRSPRRSGRL